jgi:hypothetical protein
MGVGLCSASGAGDQRNVRCHRAGLYTLGLGSLAAWQRAGGVGCYHAWLVEIEVHAFRGGNEKARVGACAAPP